MIHSQRRVPKRFPTNIAKVARRKLVQLNNATVLGDLAAPPEGAEQVETVDYY
jgi:plasmid maintenance system killer protein